MSEIKISDAAREAADREIADAYQRATLKLANAKGYYIQLAIDAATESLRGDVSTLKHVLKLEEEKIIQQPIMNVSVCCKAPYTIKENHKWSNGCIGSELVVVGTYEVCNKCGKACETEETQDQQQIPTRDKLLGYLERAGWGPCNAAACNCNGWHQVRQSRNERELEEERDKLRKALETLSQEFMHIGHATYRGGNFEFLFRELFYRVERLRPIADEALNHSKSTTQ